METIINVQDTAFLFLAISLCLIKAFDAKDLKTWIVGVTVIVFLLSCLSIIITTLIRIWG